MRGSGARRAWPSASGARQGNGTPWRTGTCPHRRTAVRRGHFPNGGGFISTRCAHQVLGAGRSAEWLSSCMVRPEIICCHGHGLKVRLAAGRHIIAALRIMVSASSARSATMGSNTRPRRGARSSSPRAKCTLPECPKCRSRSATGAHRRPRSGRRRRAPQPAWGWTFSDRR